MGIPHAVLAGGCIPFAVVVVVTFIFCWIYIRLFQHHSASEVSTTIVSIFALFVTLLTSAVVPVDVFLVSYMKYPNGTFKNWAADNETRSSIENTVTYTYYGLYGLVALFIFFILPFMYFFYEEKDDEDVSRNQRCCTAMKYTLVFVFIAIVILITGAFIPLKMPPKNITNIDSEFKFLADQLKTYSNVEQAMSILVGILSIFGMLPMIMYTGFGMSTLPINMLKCCRQYKTVESTKRLSRKEKDNETLRILRAKERAGRKLTRFERNEYRRIEQDEVLLYRLERKKQRMKKGWCGKCLLLLKPFEVVFGVFFLSLSLLLMVSLTITSIDKLKHSHGPKAGYALPHPVYPNPVNLVMVLAQKIFPLDYVLFSFMALYFIFACMNGIKRMGIWCCCIKMFKIRMNRTMPQALLFMVFIMMFTVVALNIVIFTISPQYVQYGNQKYSVTINEHTNHTQMVMKKCSTEAPSEMCIMSRIALLLNTLFYKAWFFGAFYFWSICVFIAVYFLGLFYNLFCMCRKRSEEELLSSDDDSDAFSETEALVVA